MTSHDDIEDLINDFNRIEEIEQEFGIHNENGDRKGHASITNQSQEEDQPKSAAQKTLDLIDQHCHELFTGMECLMLQ